VLGGAQSLHTNSRDEALGLPTADAARLALRTQQIIAAETGVINTVDPVGGCYAIEALTGEIEERTFAYLRKIDDLGGMLPAIESGWVQSQIQEAAYAYQRSIESRERVVVGVNDFQMEDTTAVPLHTLDPRREREQIARLQSVREKRDAGAVSRALEELETASRSDENLMPCILRAVEAYASVGEISDVFRKVHGEFREAVTI
jgi:methylmalonyl-CoA mutase N-terminal domain/subunit